MVGGAVRAGEGLMGLPFPQEDGYPHPIAAAAFQVMLIALE